MAEPISDRSKFAVTEASVWSDFQGPGKDSFRCAFSKLSSSDLRYDVLWNVNGLWIYEDITESSQSSDVLPASRATLREGFTVSLRKVYRKWTRFAKDWPRRLAWKIYRFLNTIFEGKAQKPLFCLIFFVCTSFSLKNPMWNVCIQTCSSYIRHRNGVAHH